MDKVMKSRRVQGGLLACVSVAYVSWVAKDRFGSDNEVAVENARERGRRRGEAKFKKEMREQASSENGSGSSGDEKR